jgi:hypothetical protein
MWTGASVSAAAAFSGVGASLTAILLSGGNRTNTVGVGTTILDVFGHNGSSLWIFSGDFASKTTSMPAINCAQLTLVAVGVPQYSHAVGTLAVRPFLK